MSHLEKSCKSIVDHQYFHRLVIGLILFSSLVLGLETSSDLRNQYSGLFFLLDRTVLGFFVLELAIKILAEGRSPWRFFKSGWNTADFLIVVGCIIPSSSGAFAVFRLVRVLRILRLVAAFPKLRVIVNALFKSIPSMGSVSVLLLIHFYAFAVLGVFLFGNNDPIHFGNLGKSFLSLFTILTLEGWVDIMKVQMNGCLTSDMSALRDLCDSSHAQPVAAVLYFLSFIVLGTMIILNLLIGVVVGSMAEAQEIEKVDSKESQSIQTLLAELKADLATIKSKL